jgi:hypothetical protein
MRAFDGECEPLVPVDVVDQIAWVTKLAHETWPNWAKGSHYPSVVEDPNWEGLKQQTDTLVHRLLYDHFNGCRDTYRCITTIHPDDYVPPHTDTKPDGWISRIHCPLITNPEAWFIIGGREHHLDVGMSYQVNPGIPHAVRNMGDCSRVHLMFDVVRGE